MAIDTDSTMTTATISDVNPIPLLAVVSSTTPYTVTVEYGSTAIDAIDDSFGTVPATVVVNVTSTTVPSGHHLTASGDGSWTLNTSSSITGVFTVASPEGLECSFTVELSDGTSVVASHDPRLFIRRS